MPGHYYGYTFITIDPNGDDVRYEIDWGDGDIYGWSIVFESDELFKKSHKWSSYGNFTIKARAKDVYGAVGEWSSYIVTMSRNKAMINSLFLRFLERFPLLQRLL
jgi:hypothetical protein